MRRRVVQRGVGARDAGGVATAGCTLDRAGGWVDADRDEM